MWWSGLDPNKCFGFELGHWDRPRSLWCSGPLENRPVWLLGSGKRGNSFFFFFGKEKTAQHDIICILLLQVFDSPHLKVMVGKRIRKRLDAKSIVQLLHSFDAPIGMTIVFFFFGEMVVNFIVFVGLFGCF